MNNNTLEVQLVPKGPNRGPEVPTQGLGLLRLRHYMSDLRMRLRQDNSLELWKEFVKTHYAPKAKMGLCCSSYGCTGSTSLDVHFAAKKVDALLCSICGSTSGKLFEISFELLPRLMHIRFADGALNEIWFLEHPKESELSSGMKLLEHGNAVVETFYKHARVVHTGHLRLLFNPDLKISKWEFCILKHEEFLNSKLLTPQVNNLQQIVKIFEACVAQSTPAVSPQIYADACTKLSSATYQLSNHLERLSLNELGFSKRYMRYLQLAQVGNAMGSIIDFSSDTKMAPRESLDKYPDRAALNLPPQQLPAAQGGHQAVGRMNPTMTSIQPLMNNNPTITSIQPLMNNNYTINNNPGERLNCSLQNFPRHSGISNQLPNCITRHPNSSAPPNSSNEANENRVIQQMVQEMRNQKEALLRTAWLPSGMNLGEEARDSAVRLAGSNVAESSSPSMFNSLPSVQRNILNNSMFNSLPTIQRDVPDIGPPSVPPSVFNGMPTIQRQARNNGPLSVSYSLPTIQRETPTNDLCLLAFDNTGLPVYGNGNGNGNGAVATGEQ